MEFDWAPLAHERWRDLLREAPRANLLQSWPYAVAACLHDQMMSRRGLIMQRGRMTGFMQIQEIKLGPIHVVKLYRGPLWLDPDPPEDRWRSPLPIEPSAETGTLAPRVVRTGQASPAVVASRDRPEGGRCAELRPWRRQPSPGRGCDHLQGGLGARDVVLTGPFG